jgi:hypothetical protein
VTPRPAPGRGVAIAVASTLVFVGAIALLVSRSPGWDRFKSYFFDWEI